MDLGSFDQMPYSVEDLYAYLDARVYGQHIAKWGLSRAVHWNMDRRRRKSRGEDVRTLPDRVNVLLAGPSSQGKTHLVKTLAEAVDVPFIETEATRYSAAGYKGSNAEDLVEQVLKESAYNANRAGSALVLFDETDKIKMRERLVGADVGGIAVQQAFLTIFGGARVTVSSGVVDTSGMTFIAAGVFPEMELTPQKLEQIPAVDLIRFGMIPEFVRRFSTRLGLVLLSPSEMADYLCNCPSSPLQQWKNLLETRGISLLVEDEWVRAVVLEASRIGTGLAGLIDVVKQKLAPLYDVYMRLPPGSQVVLSEQGILLPELNAALPQRSSFPFASGEQKELPPLPALPPPRSEPRPTPRFPREKPGRPLRLEDLGPSGFDDEVPPSPPPAAKSRVSRPTAPTENAGTAVALSELWQQMVTLVKGHPVKTVALLVLTVMCGIYLGKFFDKKAGPTGSGDRPGIEKNEGRGRLFPELDYPPSR